MRIGVDIRCLLEAQPGGIPHYTRQLLRELLTVDQQNEYVLFANSWRRPPFTISQPGAKLLYFRWPNKLFNSCMAILKRPYLDRLVGGVDLLYLPNLNFINVSPVCPMVLTVHDLSFELFPRFLSRKRRLWHQLIRPRHLCHRAVHLIAVSEQTKRDLIDLYAIPEDKITVIYPGLDDTIAQSPSETEVASVKQRYQLVQPYFLSISYQEPRKNLVALLQAFDRLKEQTGLGYELVLIGAPAWKKNELRSAHRKLKHASAVRLLGYVSDRDKWSLLRGADIFIYPSVYEGFGFPPLEAIRSGVPVIASAAASLPEVLGAAAILVQPYNLAEMVEALRQVALDQTLRAYLIKKQRQILESYTWRRTAEQTLQLFNNLAQQRHANWP